MSLGSPNPERKLPYHGKVRVLLPFDPWRILITLRGLQLSAHAVDALYERPSSSRMEPSRGEGSIQGSVDALMVEGDPYELQLEHDEPHLSAPVLRARLVRRISGTHGLELGFAFDSPDSDLLGLMHELMHKDMR